MKGAKALWLDFWKRRTARLERNNTHVTGIVERPLPGQPFLYVIEVRGWARERDGAPAEIRVEVGKQVVKEAATSDPDGAFQFLLRRSALPARRISWFTVSARPRGGRHTAYERIASFPIVRTNGVPRSLPRQAYGSVWDRVSQSFRDAQIAVAGYTDSAEWNRSGQSTADSVRRKASIGANDVVVEIGCGAGRVGVHLARHCREWVGCDVSANMLLHAAEALQGVSNVRFVRLNGYDLEGLTDESADVIYCTAVFMHLEEWDRFRYVREAQRVLKPGGRVYYDSFDLLSEEGWALFEAMERLDPAMRRPNVSKSSTPQELLRYAEKAGFVDIELETGALWVTVTARKPTSPAAAATSPLVPASREHAGQTR
jgi:ubiquinone/menaquinone biosynthesis C-methylase UbiE